MKGALTDTSTTEVVCERYGCMRAATRRITHPGAAMQGTVRSYCERCAAGVLQGAWNG